jgi:hypothetical protein
VNAPRVILHIDRLVLRGVAAEQRNALVAALRDELGRRLADPAYRDALASRHVARVGPAPLAVRGSSGEGLGRQSARLIAKGIRG